MMADAFAYIFGGNIDPVSIVITRASSLAVSIGYACGIDYPECTIQELQKKADEMMYRDKAEYYRNSGINRRR